MNKLMLSCHAATGLMEKKHQGKFSFGEKAQLFFHTAMCGACRRYEKQSFLLEGLFRAKGEAPPQGEVDAQAKELQEKILLKLDAPDG